MRTHTQQYSAMSGGGLRGIYDLLAKGRGSIPGDEAVDAVRMAGCNPTARDVVKIRGVCGSRAVSFVQYQGLVEDYGGDLDHAAFEETFNFSSLVDGGSCSLERFRKIVAPAAGAAGKMDGAQWEEMVAEGRRKGAIRGSGASAKVEVKTFCAMLFGSDGP